MKSKSRNSSPKDKQPGVLKTPIQAKELILKSVCKDEVVWKLYNECRKTRKREDIRIYLQNVDFPIDVKYKTNFLGELKRKGVIKNYELKTEEKKLLPEIVEEIADLELGLLPFISPGELENAPKDYKTIDRSETDYAAFIRCDPRRVKEHLKEDYKRIIKRKEIENLFQEEQVLKCGRLRFGLGSGNAIYGNALTNFSPNGNEYRLLKTLIDNKNQVLSYDKIKEFLREGKPEAKTKNEHDISLIIKNIKRKLGILGKNPENDDLFSAHKGYAIVCDKDV